MSLIGDAIESQLHLKREVLSHYGGACVCCGEKGLAFLTLDHVDNDGKEHRELLGENRTGTKFYRWLKRNNYPTTPRLQVMCWNCNMAKARFGECPHQLFRKYQRTLHTRKRMKWVY